MNDNLMKPMSVSRQELVRKIVDGINDCNLPMFVIELILQDILNTVKSTAQQQYEIEKTQYEQQKQQMLNQSENDN